MQRPLAFRIRPEKIEDYIGQKHLLQDDGIIKKCLEHNQLFSMIFFGPPGVGKTTLATILARTLNLPYREFNAVVDNKKKLEQMFVEAEMSEGLVLVVDEVHRLNKDKQDLLLPHLESGLITLIGCTTANPYHSINPAIRSRTHLIELFPLTEDDVKEGILKAIKRGYNDEYEIDDDALSQIARVSNGDLRYAYNILEISIINSKENHITYDDVYKYATVANNSSFKGDDGHYDLVSAFQKSIRGSDVNAALYYLARLLEAGDLDSVERRLLVTAYEDIGLANPNLVARTRAATETAKIVGYPENLIPLGVQVIDLCLSPKSKSGNNAIHAAADVAKTEGLEIPRYLRLTPVGMKEEDKYDYDNPSIWHKIQYLPDRIKDMEFYTPGNNQYEQQLLKNYQELKKFKRTNKISSLKKK